MSEYKSPLERVEDYVKGVLSGDVVAGKWVRLAVERHVSDLERQDTEEFPYHFCEETADDVSLFFAAAFRHSQGKWDGEPFELSPWQCFCNASLFGWKDRKGNRRFGRSHVSVGRKNGKTTWCAGLAIYLAFADGEAGAQVYIGATKLDQARLLFEEAEAMARKSKVVKGVCRFTAKGMFFGHSRSLIRPLGSDKPFDGPNPHGVFFDELHAWREQHRGFYDTMVTGSGSREQSMIGTITTAGDERSLLWKEETDYIKNILEGIIENENVFGFIAEIDEEDDPFDEACWPKANPNLGVSLNIEYLRDQAREAKDKATAKNRFLRYHCNQMVSSTERAIDLDQWDMCEEPLSDWRDADAIAGGFDLGGRDDLASYALCARFLEGETDEEQPIYRFEFRQRSFMHEDTKRNLREQPWGGWISSGRITIAKHAVQELRDCLIADCSELGVSDVAYDPYSATQMAGDLEAEGLSRSRWRRTTVSSTNRYGHCSLH